MGNWKTNIVAILKAIGALAYVVFKQMNHLPLTTEDVAIVSLAASGALGNWVSADSPKVPPQ